MKEIAWKIFYHKRIVDRLMSLRDQVLHLKATDPDNFHRNFNAKLYSCVLFGIDRARENPTRPEYRQGNTLGAKYRAWRRIKNELPPRYRLFFRYFSDNQDIFFAWLNDEITLRKEGAKTDVYATFKKMLDRQDVPNDYKGLMQDSVAEQKIKEDS